MYNYLVVVNDPRTEEDDNPRATISAPDMGLSRYSSAFPTFFVARAGNARGAADLALKRSPEATVQVQKLDGLEFRFLVGEA